ncbi:unnamed protein product [Ixodes pacificus]
MNLRGFVCAAQVLYTREYGNLKVCEHSCTLTVRSAQTRFEEQGDAATNTTTVHQVKGFVTESRRRSIHTHTHARTHILAQRYNNDSKFPPWFSFDVVCLVLAYTPRGQHTPWSHV